MQRIFRAHRPGSIRRIVTVVSPTGVAHGPLKDPISNPGAMWLQWDSASAEADGSKQYRPLFSSPLLERADSSSGPTRAIASRDRGLDGMSAWAHTAGVEVTHHAQKTATIERRILILNASSLVSVARSSFSVVLHMCLGGSPNRSRKAGVPGRSAAITAAISLDRRHALQGKPWIRRGILADLCSRVHQPTEEQDTAAGPVADEE